MFGQTDLMFIDVLRNAQQVWQAFLNPTEDPYALLNADGYPNKMANGTGQWRLINSGGQLQDPTDGFNGRWILDWTCAPGATATLDAAPSGAAGLAQSTFSTTTNPSQNGRIVYNVTSGSVPPGTAILWQVNIRACTGQITKIRLYPARYEALLNSGQQWDPDFLNFYRVYGRLRFMDWTSTNSNTITRWEQRCLPTMLSQNGKNILVPYYCGLCTSSKGDFTTATDIPAEPGLTSWTDGLMIMANIGATVAQINVQSFTLGTTTTVNANGHPFVNGDLVQFSNNAGGGGNGANSTNMMTGIGAPVFTVANALTNSFELSGINSSGWVGTSGGSVHYAMRFKAGSLPFKAISGGDGNVLFGVPPANQPVQLIYDADFDRLIYGAAPAADGTGGRMGMPIETLVDLANTLGPSVTPYFNIPHNADDTYVTNWATYVRDHLNPAIRFCVEVSNEVWNPVAGFIQTQNYTNKGAIKWGQSQIFNTETMYQYYGYRFRRVMIGIGAVFAGQMSRVNRVFAMRTTDAGSSVPSTIISHRAECPLGGFTAGDYPRNYADSLCIAPYYNLERANGIPVAHIWNVLYSGDPTLIASGLAYLDGRMRNDPTGQGSLLYYAGTSNNGQYANWAGIAALYGLKLTAYEGGWNNFPSFNVMIPSNGAYTPPSTGVPVTLTATDVLNYFFAYAASSLYGQFLTDATNAFFAAGGEFPAQYCVVNGSWSGSNMFAIKQPSRLAADIPAYTAWLALNAFSRTFTLRT